jgi:alpha-ketoglutarate-dependent taurine dioxygenase
LRATIIVYSRRIPTQSDHEEVRRSSSLSCFSVVLTEHYLELAADYFSLEYYCRYTMLHARENKTKRGACLGSH